MTYRLATKDGSHVADVEVPPFRMYPDVLIWGDRVFTYHQGIDQTDNPAEAEYREAFAVSVPVRPRRG